jgi:hypothetical protein
VLGHTFNLYIDLSFRTGNGRQCTLKWEEKPDPSYGGLPSGTFTDLYKIPSFKSKFNNWNAYLAEPLRSSGAHIVVEDDTPNFRISDFQQRTPPRQIIDFRLTVESGSGCGCPIPSSTATARQTLQTDPLIETLR